jgi:hypothetical protein
MYVVLDYGRHYIENLNIARHLDTICRSNIRVFSFRQEIQCPLCYEANCFSAGEEWQAANINHYRRSLGMRQTTIFCLVRCVQDAHSARTDGEHRSWLTNAGLLNLLVVAVPLSDRKPWSIIHTSTSLPSDPQDQQSRCLTKAPMRIYHHFPCFWASRYRATFGILRHIRTSMKLAPLILPAAKVIPGDSSRPSFRMQFPYLKTSS